MVVSDLGDGDQLLTYYVPWDPHPSAIPSSRDESSETLQKRFKMHQEWLRCALKRSTCLETAQNWRFSPVFFAADMVFLLWQCTLA